MRHYLTALILGMLITAGATVPLSARDVSCLISSTGMPTFKGTCDFATAGGKGSFMLSKSKSSGDFYKGSTTVSVAIISPGNAEVRGLTVGGINSRWGTARRSKKDGACWVGSDFTICAW